MPTVAAGQAHWLPAARFAIGPQFDDVRRDTSRLIAREQVGGSAPSGLLLIVGVSKRLPVVVADDKAGAIVFDVPWRREAASL